jgi:hypothetical protein
MAVYGIKQMGICRSYYSENMTYALLNQQFSNRFRQLDFSHDSGGWRWYILAVGDEIADHSREHRHWQLM